VLIHPYITRPDSFGRVQTLAEDQGVDERLDFEGIEKLTLRFRQCRGFHVGSDDVCHFEAPTWLNETSL
jgi:hypothetical protein